MPAMCANCQKISEQLSSVEPHGRLREKGSNSLSRIAHGRAAGYVYFYECQDCGTEWGRDCDAKDPGASWYQTRPASGTRP